MTASAESAHPDRTAAFTALVHHLEELGVEYAHPDDRTLVVVLPGTQRLKTTVALHAETHILQVEAFVCRAPEDNIAQVYEFLLRRNAQLFAISWCIDAAGDIYLRGSVPQPVSSDTLERVLGQVLEAADGDFNRLLRIGFATSIAAESAWREARGQSRAHLSALLHAETDNGMLEA